MVGDILFSCFTLPPKQNILFRALKPRPHYTQFSTLIMLFILLISIHFFYTFFFFCTFCMRSPPYCLACFAWSVSFLVFIYICYVLRCVVIICTNTSIEKLNSFYFVLQCSVSVCVCRFFCNRFWSTTKKFASLDK